MGFWDFLRRGGPTTPPSPVTPSFPVAPSAPTGARGSIPIIAIGDKRRPMTLLTSQQIQDCMLTDVPNLQQVTDAINAAFEFYGLVTERRMAAALAQFGHETGDFHKWRESGFYRDPQQIANIFRRTFGGVASRVPVEMISRRRGTWGPQDPGEDNSVRLFNRVYADILGNGNEASGDGYRFRGHGFIQGTGRAFFRDFGKTQNPIMTAEQAVEYAGTIRGAAMTGAYYFMPYRRLFICADTLDFEGVVLLTAGMKNLPGPDKDHDGKGDGDIIAYPDRHERWERCCRVLGVI